MPVNQRKRGDVFQYLAHALAVLVTRRKFEVPRTGQWTLGRDTGDAPTRRRVVRNQNVRVPAGRDCFDVRVVDPFLGEPTRPGDAISAIDGSCATDTGNTSARHRYARSAGQVDESRSKFHGISVSFGHAGHHLRRSPRTSRFNVVKCS